MGHGLKCQETCVATNRHSLICGLLRPKHDCQMSAADAASLHAKFKSKMQIAFLALRLGEKIFKILKKY